MVLAATKGEAGRVRCRRFGGRCGFARGLFEAEGSG